MRYAVAACVLAIVVFLAIFGVVLAQKGTVFSQAPAPAVAAKPEPNKAEPKTVRPAAVVTEVAPAATLARRPSWRRHLPAHRNRPRPAATAAGSLRGQCQCAWRGADHGNRHHRRAGFGFEHFKSHDFLRPGEVVLTFDDGPWPRNTGRAGRARRPLHQGRLLPDRQALDLSSRNPQAGGGGRAHGRQPHLACRPLQKGPLNSRPRTRSKRASAPCAGRWACQGRHSSASALRHPPPAVTYLGERNIAIFSTDMDSFDFS